MNWFLVGNNVVGKVVNNIIWVYALIQIITIQALQFLKEQLVEYLGKFIVFLATFFNSLKISIGKHNKAALQIDKISDRVRLLTGAKQSFFSATVARLIDF